MDILKYHIVMKNLTSFPKTIPYGQIFEASVHYRETIGAQRSI